MKISGFLATARRALAVAALAALVLPAAPVRAQDEAQGEAIGSDDVEVIENIVHQYLLQHPEVVVEAIRAYQAQQEREEAERERQAIARYIDELERDPNSHVGGNPDGDVTMVEFFDYRCTYCKRVMKSLKELRGTDDQLRMVYKEFPVLGPDSVQASRAAVASRAQGKYQQYHDALMATRGKLSREVVLQIALEVGLDVERLAADMESPEVGAVIEANYALAKTLGINATPTFVIGGRMVRGAVPIEQLKDRIAEARTE
jgi:protein-disulfide isomerase